MSKHTNAYHHAPERELPCDAFYPLTDMELQQLREAFRFSPDHYTTMSILRRVEQGILGMRTPAPTGGAVYDAAKMAVNWFVTWSHAEADSTADRDLHEQLLILLGIATAELNLLAA